jgi:TPR repeat protein
MCTTKFKRFLWACVLAIWPFCYFGMPVASVAADRTIEELQAAADAGDAQSQFLIGKAYWRGDGIEKNQVKAVEYYARAAELKHGDALAGLGAAYTLGHGVEKKDEVLAADYFRKSAEVGSAVGQVNWGIVLITGRCVERNTAEGLAWVTKAAEKDLVKAQSYLAGLYATGDDGVTRDYALAVKWVRKAVEKDDPASLNLYGVMLRDGLGVERDGAASVQYFQKAADSGVLKAYMNLGLAYFRGHGVETDRTMGMSWWYAGEALGDGLCRETATRLTRNLPIEDVSKARKLGQEMARERGPALAKMRLKKSGVY